MLIQAMRSDMSNKTKNCG